MPKKQYRDDRGDKVVLGSHCLGIGGEGAVYTIEGTSDWVAKIYSRPVPLDKVAKLSSMAQCATPELLKFAAWPRANLHDPKKNGVAVGFVMPRIKQVHPIHELYSPAQRKLHFPRADWRFLIRTARNCAAAFATLHDHSIVLGDVNQGNVLVSPGALVTLIDCDSFQIAENGRVHRCAVGVPHFTPPELQSVADFKQVDRTKNHDNFGLAVLIFHLLFMGRHPFAGRFLGSGDMPIERAIRECRFAYSVSAPRSEMEPPPNAIMLRELPREVAELFERAFGSQCRPTAVEWATALARLEDRLCKCKDDPGHVYLAQLRSCPWCRIAAQSGTNLFISVTLQMLAGHGDWIDATALWTEIERLPLPSQTIGRIAADWTSLPVITPKPLPEGSCERTPADGPRTVAERDRSATLHATARAAVAAERAAGIRTKKAAWTAFGGTVAGAVSIAIAAAANSLPLMLLSVAFAVICVLWSVGFGIKAQAQQEGAARRLRRIRAAQQHEAEQRRADRERAEQELQREAAEREAALRLAEELLGRAHDDFRNIAERYDTRFRQKVTSLGQLKNQLDSLERERAAELRSLEENGQRSQRAAHLKQFFIRDARIDGIGPNRVSTLASFGIETAFDVSKSAVLRVPGFWETLTRKLVAWRDEKERSFRFKPSKGISQADRQAIEVKYQQQRIQYARLLRHGPFELRQITATAKAEADRMCELIARRESELVQARADLGLVDAVK